MSGENIWQRAQERYVEERRRRQMGVTAVDPYAPKPEPAKLYCPAHGKINLVESPHGWHLAGKDYCAKCVADALERIGVHQLSDKPNQVTKKW